ncbi:MAG: hypothetical protein WBA93_24190 [Microcoleaceae cyanobacterium]
MNQNSIKLFGENARFAMFVESDNSDVVVESKFNQNLGPESEISIYIQI